MRIRWEAAATPEQGVFVRAARARFAGLLIVALTLPGVAAAQGKDDLWEVTVKMEMPGMPMSMPAQTNRVCVAKNSKDDDYIPKRDNCRVLESKRSGNTATFKMACTGKDAMNVAGTVTYGGDTYQGKMVMSGKMEGQAMEMTQTFAGKRVGDCTAAAK